MRERGEEGREGGKEGEREVKLRPLHSSPLAYPGPVVSEQVDTLSVNGYNDVPVGVIQKVLEVECPLTFHLPPEHDTAVGRDQL